MNPQRALGHAAALRNRPHWELVTPVAGADTELEACRFFRSISEQVDDDDKRAAFALMLNAIDRACAVSNYQEALKGSNVPVKVAHDFDYLDKKHKLWELKANKKDRLYFFAMTLCQNQRERHLIVLLLAHHKKDQNTPKEVSKPCEATMRTYLDPQAKVEIQE